MQEARAEMKVVKFKDGVPISVYNDIAAEAARDWPKDYSMQDWQIKREIEAYKKLHQ